MIYVVIGSFLFAIHIVSIQLALRPYNTWHTTSIMVYAIFAVAILLWAGDGVIQGEFNLFVPGWTGWFVIFFQGVLATFVGRVITYLAIDVIVSAQFSLLSPMETLLTIVWSVIFLSETLDPWQWLGATLIITGTLLAAENIKRPKLFGKQSAVME